MCIKSRPWQHGHETCYHINFIAVTILNLVVGTMFELCHYKLPRPLYRLKGSSCDQATPNDVHTTNCALINNKNPFSESTSQNHDHKPVIMELVVFL